LIEEIPEFDLDLRVWLGFLIFVVWIGGVYLRVRARRQSGEVGSSGHPVLDNLLLLASGILLAGLLAAMLFFFGGGRAYPIRGRFIFYTALLLVGGPSDLAM
jgi:hypothetical protein